MSDVYNRLAFVFPGQGSQRVGMLAEVAADFPVVRQTFDEASEVLALDLWDMVQSGDAETLNLTENTQPALLTGSVALWRVWRGQGGPTPAAMAGHSLGEFSALCCAGALTFADAVRIVRERGRFMQHAVPVGEGAMAAVIGLDDPAIGKICAEVTAPGSIVVAANYNAPGQVVVAGHARAVAAAGELFRAAGARKVLPLPVSAPFHTVLMRPAGESLAEVLAGIDIRTPDIPVIHNVSIGPETDPAEIRHLLVQQVSAAVPWTDCVRALVQRGCDTFVECGAGRVLSGLLRRIDPQVQGLQLEQPKALHDALDAVNSRD
jgi:[acyl-carrier-protein] S-malonyltransferase